MIRLLIVIVFLWLAYVLLKRFVFWSVNKIGRGLDYEDDMDLDEYYRIRHKLDTPQYQREWWDR
jgi:hypothetical protein